MSSVSQDKETSLIVAATFRRTYKHIYTFFTDHFYRPLFFFNYRRAIGDKYNVFTRQNKNDILKQENTFLLKILLCPIFRFSKITM